MQVFKRWLKRCLKWPLKKVYQRVKGPLLPRLRNELLGEVTCRVRNDLLGDLHWLRQELEQTRQHLTTATANLTHYRQEAETTQQREAQELSRMRLLQEEVWAELARMDRAYLEFFSDLTQQLTDEVARLHKQMEGKTVEDGAFRCARPDETSSCAA